MAASSVAAKHRKTGASSAGDGSRLRGIASWPKSFHVRMPTSQGHRPAIPFLTDPDSGYAGDPLHGTFRTDPESARVSMLPP